MLLVAGLTVVLEHSKTGRPYWSVRIIGLPNGQLLPGHFSEDEAKAAAIIAAANGMQEFMERERERLDAAKQTVERLQRSWDTIAVAVEVMKRYKPTNPPAITGDADD
jgi:hypothetical protein